MSANPAQRTATTLLAALALAGCAPMAPRHERPAAPVPAAFPGAPAAPPTAGVANAAELPWATFFADATLRSLVELALAENRDLRVAVLNIEAVRAQFDLRRADLWPTVNAGLAASRQTAASGAVVGAYSAGLNVTAYEVDLFGRVRSLGDAAAAQLLATQEARRAVQVALVAQVAQQYLALLADDELTDLTQRALTTRQESLRLTRLRLDNGVASELDLRQAQTLVEAARATQAQLQRQRQVDLNALALLAGHELPPLAPQPGRLQTLELADLPAGLPSEVLLRRPDVRQAEQQLAAAEASIGAARAAFWPRITLTASVGTASTALTDLFKDGAWSFAAQLLQPIFDAGRNRANLAQAQVQREVAVAQYERAVQAAFRDVADTLAGRATLGEQLRAAQAQADAEAARQALVDLRLRNGVASSLELLDAQRSLFAAQQAVVQTRAALLQNRVAAYRALGGGAEVDAAVKGN
jgi:multidrug efflux system outer membrane protein